PQAQVVPSTARGISIDHTISADEAHTGVLLIRLVYRNLTADSLYLAIDRPLRDNAPNQTYRTAYAGLALDVDVGDAGDDFIGYVPDQDLAFVYDSDFLEAGFDVFSESPALVGVRMLEAPAGTDIILTGWPGEWDWDGATSQEQLAWLFASGTHEEDVIPNHADPRIGYMPAVPADIRLLVTAGPIDLAPGDSAVVRLAVAIADPVAGSYTSGTAVEPGDPF
ncbi:MAG: hypothetical protein GWN51_08955, partial [Gemmatimonadetes bacterium]|nr:hypothetical protein [Gemmatimonadota bacterium]NIT66966.1 hypothetical protein [Gemmatimonadota bacterium]NIV23767.1 hypothetical protein [Gemmatimonadota bacterium]NIW75646.1 hypothetical protein [Gemmatimonadota bacterium]NIY35543.1 hypothetical protein [Gemmatimonadota bacterium]